eukprot:c47545_g1_i1.p1 GENE.c47545_g1_i1~~c47545_g1_i1.p1  ORF type:complete len:241 (+),score=39.24 c47545_g1_i1:124-846(+)
MASSGNLFHGITYLTQEQAIASDVDLMGEGTFSVDQLMELAGHACATAIALEYPVASVKSLLLIAGPGNNGGDGLVCARHLALFGYDVALLYPKRPSNPNLQKLTVQALAAGVRSVDTLPAADELAAHYGLIVDAIFGFSFKLGDGVRAPFDGYLRALAASPIPIVSLDIPSGWDVELGRQGDLGFVPAMLVSLTAPKLGTASYTGVHYVGGRYVPPWIATKYGIVLAPYVGPATCLRLH